MQGMGLGHWYRGGDRDLGMKRATRIHPLTMALIQGCATLVPKRYSSPPVPKDSQHSSPPPSNLPALARATGSSGVVPCPCAEVTDTFGPSESPQGDTSPGLVCHPTPEYRHVHPWSLALPLIALQGNILKMKIKMSVAGSHVPSTSPAHPRTLCLHRCTTRRAHTFAH